MPDDGIDRIRAEIDQLDRRIVALLAERERLVHQAGRAKTTAADVRAPDRVEKVIGRVRSMATELGATPAVVERTYRAMIAAFIDVELATFTAGSGEEAERTS
jgi:isochorismate pyruvate lyase